MPIDPDARLQHQIHYQVVNTLLRLLPPPLEDTAASREARDQAAIARVSDLRPVNADEIDIALHYVLSRAQAADVMAAIRDNAGNHALTGQLMRQYALMERTAQADRRLLLHVQSARRKREAVAEAADQDHWTAYITRRGLERAAEEGPLPQIPEPQAEPARQPAAWEEADPQQSVDIRPAPPQQAACEPAEHGAAGAMPAEPEGAGSVPAQQPAQAAPAAPLAGAARAPAEPSTVAVHTATLPPCRATTAPAPSPRAAAGRDARPQPPAGSEALSTLAWVLRGPGHNPSRDIVAEAEHYARTYPQRVRILLLHGEVPPGCDFPEPDRDLMHAIMTGDSPTLRALQPAAEAA